MEDVEAFVAKLKVIELKDELKKRSLSTAGVKSVLAQRLQEAMIKEQQQTQSEEEEATMDEQVGEDESETKMEEESSATASEEVPEQEEDQGTPPEDEEQEPSEPIPSQEEPQSDAPTSTPSQEETPSDAPTSTPSQEETPSDAPTSTPSQPEDVQISEPSTSSQPETTQDPVDVPASTPSTDSQPAPTEPVTAMPTSEGVETPMESTEQAATVSMDTPTQEADNEPEATEALVVEDETTNSQEEQTKEADEKMETTAEGGEKTENGQSQEPSDSSHVGSKRPHDREEPSKTESSKPDPSRAPDPEEPESFDDSQVLMENRFTPPEDGSIVTLDRFTSDLHFDIQEDGLGGCGLTEQGFARLWALARGSIGIKGGRYYYQVRVEENKSVQLPETEEHPHAIRIGWTIDDTRKGLGEGWGSFGYGSTGRKATTNKFDEYGESYGPGDIIGCYLDFESSPPTISYSKNNTSLGVAFPLEGTLSNKTYFPCIATKNVSFSINFGGSEPWCEVEGVEGYAFVQGAAEDHRVKAPQGPASAGECEVIMMIGLPASGKTTWAEKHCERNPSRRYNILGTNLIMEKMKVSGLSRKENYRARFEALIKEATDILNKLFLLASKNYRNYIIDQTNVYRGAQARKMKYFEGFFHKAEVVVPPHHELRRRTALRNEEMGGPLPEDAINAMKDEVAIGQVECANFHIPKVDDVFQEVSYSDIYGIAAEKIVRQYREDALGIPSYPQSKRGRYDNYRSGGGSRYGGGGGHHHSGHSGYSQHSYGSYNQRHHYGYDSGSYGYHQSRPRYNPYGSPAPPPQAYGSPRGGGYGPPQYRGSPYGNQGSYGGQYHGNYGGPPPPPRRGGNYYGRY